MFLSFLSVFFVNPCPVSKLLLCNAVQLEYTAKHQVMMLSPQLQVQGAQQTALAFHPQHITTPFRSHTPLLPFPCLYTPFHSAYAPPPPPAILLSTVRRNPNSASLSNAQHRMLCQQFQCLCHPLVMPMTDPLGSFVESQPLVKSQGVGAVHDGDAFHLSCAMWEQKKGGTKQ